MTYAQHVFSSFDFVEIDQNGPLLQLLNDVDIGIFLQNSMAMTGGTAADLPMSNHTRERVTVAKLTLENFYSTLLTQHEEREMR